VTADHCKRAVISTVPRRGWRNVCPARFGTTSRTNGSHPEVPVMGIEDTKADVKETLRNVDNQAKETWRKADGNESLSDKVANAGDDVRDALGNAGDEVRRHSDDMDERNV
jgi:hypothetical protein